MKGHILMVEDDPVQRALIQEYLEDQGFTVHACGTLKEARVYLKRHTPDALLLDHRLPDGSGLEALPELHTLDPLLPVVLFTAYGRIEDAVEAMKRGAFHYLTKPVHLQELALLLERAVEHARLMRQEERLRSMLIPASLPVEGIAESPVMQQLLQQVHQVAPTDTTVLITGESGTGKEWLARLIHALSHRASRPFLAVNLAAVPESLMEAELFGYEKGAFTGADQRRAGILEAADGGPLLLDEIGELPQSAQVKLLRFLQEQEFFRLGSTRPIRVNTRILAATHRDLERLVREGSFREDLYYRLNVIRLRLPPLRERREDILPLAHHFLDRYRRKYHKPIEGFAEDAVAFLLSYAFPGNIRELQNMVERAVILAHPPRIHRADLTGEPAPSSGTPSPTHLDERLREVERALILEALRRFNGVQTRAAAWLGLSERALRYRMERLGLDNPYRSRSS
ncbi:MAG: sigma-54 dependent transcriptional regulator [Candidatus Hydrothermae bacterium]|nr:sigma-54 dependent transcriptional regulator [Candidatus Hydrothermae bacterium]